VGDIDIPRYSFVSCFLVVVVIIIIFFFFFFLIAIVVIIVIVILQPTIYSTESSSLSPTNTNIINISTFNKQPHQTRIIASYTAASLLCIPSEERTHAGLSPCIHPGQCSAHGHSLSGTCT